MSDERKFKCIREIFEWNGFLFYKRRLGLTLGKTAMLTLRTLETIAAEIVRETEQISIIESHENGDIEKITSCRSFLVTDKENAFEYFKKLVLEFEENMPMDAIKDCFLQGGYSDGGYSVTVLGVPILLKEDGGDY